MVDVGFAIIWTVYIIQNLDFYMENGQVGNQEKDSQKISNESEIKQQPSIDDNPQGYSPKNGTMDLFYHDHEDKSKEEDQTESPRAKALRKVIQSLGFQIFITILALYSLFSDDIRMAAFDSSADLGFDIVHIILMVIFLVEIILSWYSIPDYKLSFYFFLDVISSLSLILDVSMITEMMYARNDSSYNLNQLATQSRASRVATRAVRIVKLVRIIRIVKMYKAAFQAAEIKEQLKKKRLANNIRKQKLKNNSSEHSSDKDLRKARTDNGMLSAEVTGENFMEQREQKILTQTDSNNRKQKHKQEEKQFVYDAEMLQEMSQKESQISKVLSELTIKKVVIIVLLIMFLVPLFDSDNYIQRSDSWDYTAKNVVQLLKNPNIPLSTINDLIKSTIEQRSQGQYYPLLFLTPFNELHEFTHEKFSEQRSHDITISVTELTVAEVQQLLSLRPQLTLKPEIQALIDSNQQQITIEIQGVTNYRKKNQLSALFSMAKTVFVCIVLSGMLHFFTEDINSLIVRPIEEMMNHVMEIAKNPESAAISEIDNSRYETSIVHNAIIKIGALLSLVFGAAGAEIIGSNIMKQGDMNPLIGGKKKCAIFGFCDIRNFTEVTEVLQEDIMLFVNKIGELVHSSVYRYGGSANKNIGQAFLLVWPLPDDSYHINNKSNKITWKKRDYISIMSDFSVFSFVKAIVKIHKEPEVLDYKQDTRLTDALGSDFQVKMGFGLHIGWAIEGAIGSDYKIDASYLSPNVNMASRLEAATRQFGVNLLISEDLHEMLSPGLQAYCRNIDRVTVKGSAKPIRLYTVDLNLQKITPPANKVSKYQNPDDQLDVEIKKQINLEYLSEENNHKYQADSFIKKKKQLREVMVNAVPEYFLKRFESGLECYLQGNWPDARLHLTEALKNGKNDGPTKNILNFMKKSDYCAPADWKNYRPLTSK